VFSFWSVPRLLPEEEEVRCYLLSERPLESGNILDKSTLKVSGYLDVVGGLCLFDLKKADQRQSEIN
jgi:hypothetical protein